MADEIQRRTRELTGIEIRGAPRIFSDTSNYIAIDRGDVLLLGGELYVVVGTEREGRFGIDEQPKFWVKRAVSLATGAVYIVKLVFLESFLSHVDGLPYECERSAAKEAQVLDVVRHHPNFMQGRGVLDAAGNLVRVIDFIPGQTLLQVLGGLDLRHEEYVERVLPGLLAQTYDCFAGIEYLHRRGLCHGDIRNDHIIIDSTTGRARWIDFDYARPSLVFDVWCLGNVLNFVLAKGFVTFHALRRSHPELSERVARDDASVFFAHRVMNVDKIYPWLPACLAAMLRRFAVGGTTRYDRAEQVVSELGACMDTLGWRRRDAPEGAEPAGPGAH